MKTIACILTGLSILSCTKLTQQDALQGTLSPKGALGMLGFAKDLNDNYIVLVMQNNLYNNDEAILTKVSNDGKFITDVPVIGREDKDHGKNPNVQGTPGRFGSGRLAYNPDKNEIVVFTCLQAEHQSSYYRIASNDNATFGAAIKQKGFLSYGHNFDQRTVYHNPTKMFYQLAHGDAYPKNLGFYTTSTDQTSPTFNSVLVNIPLDQLGVPGNPTQSRLGDLDIFTDGTVATTFMTAFYDTTFMGNVMNNRPCYNPPTKITAETSVLVWNAVTEAKYPRNVFLYVIPYQGKSLIQNTGIGITPVAINLSNYTVGSGKVGAIAKTAVVNEDKIFVAWLEYTDGNLDGTWFAVYGKNGNKLKQEFIPSTDNPLIFHTVSIMRDPNNQNVVKWITPNTSELVYHQLDVNAFIGGSFEGAHQKKSIPLENAKTVAPKSPNAQMSPIGLYGMNPQIDYVMNKDGSMDILWMNINAVTKTDGRNFYPLLVTSIDNNGGVKKVITLEVRAAK